MYKSIEVRWFFSEQPTALEEWFAKYTEDVYETNERSDFYLDLNGYANLSYKIREGKTELKTLTEILAEAIPVLSKKGIVEKWVKWGPSMKESLKTVSEVFKDEESFIEMKKGRVLVKFDIQANDRLLKAEKNIKEGCQVELTKLKIEGQTSYTFGLEAFGSDDKLMRNMTLVAEKVFTELPDMPLLSVDNSYSYPVFLSRVRNVAPWKR